MDSGCSIVIRPMRLLTNILSLNDNKPVAKYLLTAFLVFFTYPKPWGVPSFSIFDEVNKLSGRILNQFIDETNREFNFSQYYDPVLKNKNETESEIKRVYSWLSEQNFEGCIFEYPQENGKEPQAAYNILSILHWKPGLLGYTSTPNPFADKVIIKAREFPSESSISMVRERKLKYIIVHRRFLRNYEWDNFRRKLEKFSSDIVFVKEFGTDIVFELIQDKN